ncbi:TolC family protein [Lujinxingia vulgaris]|uniref:TolC family protein n=1 Tax=Lujinxingia vulgaris TaxID=2600176 RepID=A0A5C6XIN6_9DELT|nr:TolC family protein [Lujinxingia vulgaris]TXD39378.1 TolC family protein [Lujinxingia vulgaris]
MPCTRLSAGALALIIGVSLVASAPAARAEDTPETSAEGQGADDALLLTLDEVEARARRSDDLQAEQQARRDHARWQSYRADRAWWPKLEAQTLVAPVPANADPSRIDENLDEILALNLGPLVRQTARVIVPVYTFGRIGLAQELAEVGVDVAEIQAAEAVETQLLRARQAFFGRQLAEAFGSLLTEGEALVNQTLRDMEDARDFGEADFSTEDLRRLQIFKAELDTMVLDNARLRDLSESALRYITEVDQPLSVPPLDPAQADMPLASLQACQSFAEANRPDLKKLAGAIRARELQSTMARRDFLPNVFAAADFGFAWSTESPALQRVCRRAASGEPCVNVDTLWTRPYSNPLNSLTFGVALGLRWNFDFAQQRGKVGEADAKLAELKAQARRARGAVALEVEQAWRTAADARERLHIEQRRLDAARRWRNQYGLTQELSEATDMRDALDPLRAYYEAQVAVLESAHSYLDARARLARAIGAPSLDRLSDLGGQPATN